jgi:hypothetical protein
MLSNKSMTVLILVLLASTLSAWSITDTYMGNRYGSMDARSFAMGSAGLYNDARAFGISENPANLTLMKRFAGLQMNTVITRAEDVRMIPLYNSFDSYIDDAVYASNINAYTNFAGAGFGAMRFDNIGVGLGVYHRPFASFEGNYREEIRNNRNTDNDGYPEKIAQNDIEDTGNLNKTGFVLSAAYALGDYMDFNLGFDLGLMNADVSQETTIKWSQWALDQVDEGVVLPEYHRLAEWELSGTQMKIGTAMRIGPRFGFAATFTPKTSLDITGTDMKRRDAYRNTAMDSTMVVLDGDWDMPSELKIGFAYFPRNIMRTQFKMDIEMVNYQDVMDAFDTAYNFYAGVEHHITHRMPLRLGFQAVNSYFYDTEAGVNADGDAITLVKASKVLTPMITGGSAVQLANNITLDLGFGYAWRDYQALDLFGDAYYNDKIYTGSSSYVLWPNSYINLQNRGWDNPDKVKENYITLNAGLSIGW